MRVFAIQVETPAVKATDKLGFLSTGISCALGGVYEAAAAMRAHVVVGAYPIGRCAQNRVKVIAHEVSVIMPLFLRFYSTSCDLERGQIAATASCPSAQRG